MVFVSPAPAIPEQPTSKPNIKDKRVILISFIGKSSDFGYLRSTRLPVEFCGAAL